MPAISASSLGTGTATVDNHGTVTASSITYLASGIVVVGLSIVRTDGVVTTITGVADDLGFAFTSLASVLHSGNQQRTHLWYGLPPASSGRTITATLSGSTTDSSAMIVDELFGLTMTGTNGANAFVQNATAQSTGTAIGPATLGSFEAGGRNATYALIGSALSGTLTAGMGSQVSLATASDGTQSKAMSEFTTGQDTGPDATGTNAAALNGIVGVELRAAKSDDDGRNGWRRRYPRLRAA